MKYFQSLAYILVAFIILICPATMAQSTDLRIRVTKPFSVSQNIMAENYDAYVNLGMDYTFLHQNRLSLGVGLGVSYFDLNEYSFSMDSRQSLVSTATVIFGYRLGRFTPKVFSGLAWQHFSESTYRYLNFRISDYDQFGFCAGAGLDMRIVRRFSLITEYLYAQYKLGEQYQQYWGAGSGGGDNLSMQNIKVGLGFRF